MADDKRKLIRKWANTIIESFAIKGYGQDQKVLVLTERAASVDAGRWATGCWAQPGKC